VLYQAELHPELWRDPAPSVRAARAAGRAVY